MNDKLLCPFCQQELVGYVDVDNRDKILFYCNKCNSDVVGSVELWQALMDTKKKLDICVDALKDMSEIIKNYEYGNGLYYALDSHDTMLIANYVGETICLIKDNDKDVK